EINLYRIIQESVNNILKHSGATEANIEMKRVEQGLAVTIRDNGKGFVADPESIGGAPHTGLGLMGIAERARMLGGKYSIQSTPGAGTTVRVEIDLRNDNNGR